MAKTNQGSLFEPVSASKKKGTDKINYKTLLYTNPNIDLGLAASGLQKAIRAGDEILALQMAFIILPRFPFYLWRRLAVIASEDVGPANPQAAILVSALYNSWVLSRAKNSEFTGRTLIAQATLALARSGKNRENDHITWLVGNQIEQNERIDLPDVIRDMHTAEGRRLGRGFKHFVDEASRLTNPQGKDAYRDRCLAYLKKIGKYT
ncbi:MAG: hypothetical protein M1383_02180 [Patescibacteria group bacterium]|nr:hypothetical protein [Patescibacteria group bacterium]